MYFTYLPFGSIFAYNPRLIAAFYSDRRHRNLARQSSLPSPARLTEHNSWSSAPSESTLTSSFGGASEKELSSIDLGSVASRFSYEWLSIIHCKYLIEFTCRFTSMSEKSKRNRASSLPLFSARTFPRSVSIPSFPRCHRRLSDFWSNHCGRPLVVSSIIQDEVAEISFSPAPEFIVKLRSA